MIHNIKVKNFRGEELVMELENPEPSGFAIFNMTGIGPEKADVRITDIVTADGGFYNSSRLPPRNIVLSLRYYRTEERTVEEIRHESYKYFAIKQPLTLTIETDNRIGEIEGYTESNEPVIFSRESHTQISIVCPYPYFYDGGPNGTMVTEFLAVEPLFEFPFSNESLTENLLIMGEIWPETTRAIFYPGDAEVGVTIHIFLVGPVSDITIYNPDTDQKMTISNERLQVLTGSTLIEGDHITIVTTRGNKSISLTRAGVTYNILNALNRDAFWFQMVKGDNVFAYTAEMGLDHINFRIENRIVYEGM